MRISNYITRNYRNNDFDNYVRLHIEAERWDRKGYRTSSLSISERLGRPKFSPEDHIFLAEINGEIVGCLDVTLELDIGRVVINGLIHPAHRRRKLATRLIIDAMSYASSLGVDVVHGAVISGNAAGRSLLMDLDFNYVHRFLELTTRLTSDLAQDARNATVNCRPLQCGEEIILTELQNSCFINTWGFQPNTIEEITYCINLSECCPEGVILVCDSGQPVGYCWTTIDVERNITSGIHRGRISMIGILPDYRGKGLGRKVLLASLSYLFSRGIDVVDLGVDSENNEAHALYESVGFIYRSNIDWYEKRLT